jgi:hypothetical protein
MGATNGFSKAYGKLCTLPWSLKKKLPIFPIRLLNSCLQLLCSFTNAILQDGLGKSVKILNLFAISNTNIYLYCSRMIYKKVTNLKVLFLFSEEKKEGHKTLGLYL